MGFDFRVNIDDKSKYKRCQKKKYKVWVCMPPIGTCVINKLEQPEVVQQLKGKTYFTVLEMKNIRENNSSLYDYLSTHAYIVDEKKRYVLSGTQGELWVIDPYKLQKTYIFATGEEISISSLQKRMNSNKCIDWQLLETKVENNYNYACFVPKKQKLTIQTAWGSTLVGNAPCLKHGKGDFVVCSDGGNGQPNLNDRWIVNGLIFRDTYDNRGWTDKLEMTDSLGSVSSNLEKPSYSLVDITGYKNSTVNRLPKWMVYEALSDNYIIQVLRKYKRGQAFPEELKNYVTSNYLHKNFKADNVPAFMKSQNYDVEQYLKDIIYNASSVFIQNTQGSKKLYLPLLENLYVDIFGKVNFSDLFKTINGLGAFSKMTFSRKDAIASLFGTANNKYWTSDESYKKILSVGSLLKALPTLYCVLEVDMTNKTRFMKASDDSGIVLWNPKVKILGVKETAKAPDGKTIIILKGRLMEQ